MSVCFSVCMSIHLKILTNVCWIVHKKSNFLFRKHICSTNYIWMEEGEWCELIIIGCGLFVMKNLQEDFVRSNLLKRQAYATTTTTKVLNSDTYLKQFLIKFLPFLLALIYLISVAIRHIMQSGSGIFHYQSCRQCKY